MANHYLRFRPLGEEQCGFLGLRRWQAAQDKGSKNVELWFHSGTGQNVLSIRAPARMLRAWAEKIISVLDAERLPGDLHEPH